MAFYRQIIQDIQSRALHCRARLAFRLIRLRNRMDLFKTVPEDVPF
jgi:hypothetical protein